MIKKLEINRQVFGLILISVIALSFVSSTTFSQLKDKENNAEQFIIVKHPEKSRRRKSSSQLKQDIAQALIDLLKLESRSIGLSAQVQQHLYERTEELMEKDKKSFFEKASYRQLENCLEKAAMYVSQVEQEISRKQQLLAFVSTGCEVK